MNNGFYEFSRGSQETTTTSSVFPYTGLAIISGSLIITGSVVSTQGFTGSLFGTSSWAVSASWAPPTTPGGLDTQIQFNSGSKFTGSNSFTFNYQNQSLQQGNTVTASGIYSHAEGVTTIASGDYSHAEGRLTTASGNYSHAEGFSTIASGSTSHAEGDQTIAEGGAAHAEGRSTQAIGTYSHAEGISTQAIGYASHAEGSNTVASGLYSHAEGFFTVALGNYQHVQGAYNISSSEQGAFIIGNGINPVNRSNLVFASGSIFQITGSLRVSGSITGSLFGTASQAISSSRAISASFASTASFAPNYLPLSGGTITGSLTITNNLTVLGSASIQYISESTLNIGTNLITVNTFTPTARFGGLAIIDSGSSPIVSASFLYDSLQDEFIFVHKGTAAGAITSSHFVLGPETYNNLGNETYLTANRIPKGVGNEHLNDSNISDNGSVVSINSNSEITGSLIVTQGITGSLFGTASWADNAISSSISLTAISASFASTSSFITNLNQNVQITGSVNISGSLVVNNVDIQSTIVAMAIALG